MGQNRQAPWQRFKGLIGTHDLPELGPAPRAGRFSLAELRQKLDPFLAAASLPSEAIPPLQSAALLWHDYLEESHAISQQLHTADSSFLHGIMHRREPDYGNARYWFQRLGNHPCFPTLAGEVTKLLKIKGAKELSARLVPQDEWDPFAFIEACDRANQRGASAELRQILRAIQELEFDSLLAHLCRGIKG
jgi:hypothetical protein